MSKPWRPSTVIAFRFCVVYAGLFCLLFAQIMFVYAGILTRWLPADAAIWQMTVVEPVLTWVGRHVFGVEAVLLRDSNSGDQTIVWVMVFVLLVVAGVATLIWSLVDRRRTEYTREYAWFSTFVRVSLGGQMLFYGVAKLVPTQMPSPPLAALLQPFGDFTPMGVLWLQVGSSHPYEIALGAVEVAGGVLLFWGRTAALGAVVSAMAMAQVFLLNMTYGVPVKILSFHLLMLSLFLVAPHTRRLAEVLVFQRRADPAVPPDLFSTARANRIATVTVALLGVWVAVGVIAEGWSAWRDYGDGRPKPPLYGIWAVTEFIADGAPRAPLITDELRWQHLIFDQPGVLTYQKMDGELVDEPAVVDAGTITLPGLGSTLRYQRPAPDRMVIDGELAGRPVRMVVAQEDLDSFPLRSTGFRWVQNYPRFS